jgi:hypothetical protein
VLLAVGCRSAEKPPAPPAPKAEPPVEVKEVKFRGPITDAQFDCAVDGRCEITVKTPEGPRDVEISEGMVEGGERKPRGQAWDLHAFISGTRTDFVGVEVEVFGQGSFHATILGDRRYYVRLAKPSWPVPDGWGREQIMFPLEFSPSLNHRGMEELRFAPGFLKDGSPNRWSYAFAWDLTDEADLDAATLAAELTTYFRGLLVEVDADRKRFDANAITSSAEKRGDIFVVKAHIFDAFGDGKAIDLEGTAKRTACSRERTMWRFVMAPAASPIRKELDALALVAPCG